MTYAQKKDQGSSHKRSLLESQLSPSASLRFLYGLLRRWGTMGPQAPNPAKGFHPLTLLRFARKKGFSFMKIPAASIRSGFMFPYFTG